MKNSRASGILLHPTSLPGPFGIGTLGTEALAFIDFLDRTKQKYWQILPLGPTGYGDSPYQCFSSFAGNPLLINLEELLAEELISPADLIPLQPMNGEPVDYGMQVSLKIPVLRKAASNFSKSKHKNLNKEFCEFREKNKQWLHEFATFMALKSHFNQKPWYQWEKNIKLREEKTLKSLESELSKEIGIQEFIQFLFFRQWKKVKEYANSKNILIIGDIPLYIALDSADAWAHPELFEFDEDRNPINVGGVPPDYFSVTGQLWGNPIFRWEKHKETGYRWWIDRIKGNLELYDVIRIDHFRGFAAYWSVPYGESTAVNGRWVDGPGMELFDAIKEEIGDLPVIAEDLGVITEDVEELRDKFEFPGMKILQFAFDANGANEYLPHNYPKNCIVYTGTHDNDTMAGWFEKNPQENREYILEYLQSDGKNICGDFVRLALSSVANTAIIPMQDLLGEGSCSRMNFPGTTSNNWVWRMKPNQITEQLEKRLEYLTRLYGRENRKT